MSTEPAPEQAPPATADDSGQARFDRGLETLNRINSDAVPLVLDSLADVSPELARQIVAWGFGEIYSRPALPPRDRQLLTLGILTALGGCEPQLEVHLNTALNVGLTPEEIVEALLHAAGYAGFPRALNATFVAKKVFAERGLLPVDQK
ncbi:MULTISPECIES: carboxymuconolactone decarboxylase family protein [unclassified Streptomyces]|uniref:carboxymuconolactone decarboxylase family protein n=1 Tax=unclassified Streptomyces TaxID=2593676 RepID=UPI000DB91D3F|nr:MULTISPECIES: carboxymuconolactone decarboxylase family protein [unclassified Streptomyces]MYT74305.1 carboxymuconolactone decarboxylase family protein [Streptomyces sp. SID8367]RAJ91281.1 4-carboxymuconolactone decarboxylase [Streptomyces sp. PsTaAH-137]